MDKEKTNEEIEKRNVYGFLWFNKNDSMFNRNIRAKNIESACKKFLSNKPKTILRLDYEIQFGKNYIDISSRIEFKKWL